ncbi:hypothetical protein JG688_00017517 [Phytophthora aleatoria]|uniref:Uncharacterized protein n=1 Tax=Phytophthora aleatoria TaxID=2496075 RepID=A0A8J5LYH6_9STRA|nr:hypothetical protein JG688_00017517 [Phytophthora aleatoria]
MYFSKTLSYKFIIGQFPSRWNGWEAFHTEFERFCEETYQRFPGRSSTSVSARNKKMKENKKQHNTSLIPEEWGIYSKTLVCTHGYKYKPKGSGERQHELVRYMGCTALINIRVMWNGSWYIFVDPKGFQGCFYFGSYTVLIRLKIRTCDLKYELIIA